VKRVLFGFIAIALATVYLATVAPGDVQANSAEPADTSDNVQQVIQDLPDTLGEATNDFNILAFTDKHNYNGSVWSNMNSGTSRGLSDIWGSTAGDIFTVGDIGEVRRFNGNSWNKMVCGTYNDFLSVWGFSPTDVFVSGFGGTVLHYGY
jgi:hypothetical protein